MLRSVFCCVFLLTALFIVGLSSALAAWTQKEGEGLSITSGFLSDADERFSTDGGREAAIPFNAALVQFYGAYGVRDWLTAITGGGYLWRQSGRSDDTLLIATIEPTEIGARIRLYAEGSSVISVQPLLRVPGELGGTVIGPYGSQGYDIETRVLFGHNETLFGLPMFMDAQAAYRYRFGGEADELRLDLTAGATVFPQLHLLLQSFTVIGVGEAEPPFLAYDQVKLQASAVYEVFDGVSIQAGLSATLYGREVIAERGAMLGLWWRYSL
ncbi:MAG: hypothetical protein HXY22_05125 [Alphaproteobacteria bacterium]|nr:hypothetical protein [Alphaproteobacteria bacterium]